MAIGLKINNLHQKYCLRATNEGLNACISAYFSKNIFFRLDVKTSPKMDKSEKFVNADKFLVKIRVSSRDNAFVIFV